MAANLSAAAIGIATSTTATTTATSTAIKLDYLSSEYSAETDISSSSSSHDAASASTARDGVVTYCRRGVVFLFND